MRRVDSWVVVLFSTSLLAACGNNASGSGGGGAGGASNTGGSGGTTASTGGSGGSVMLHGECPSDKQVGYFYIQNEIDYSVVSGEVLDGVVPSKVLFEVGKEGDCTLWQRKNPFCNPACQPNQACSQDMTCVPYPLPQDAGQITIAGLTKAVSMAYPNYYDTTVDHPPFTPGTAVTLDAKGATIPAFTLHGAGFAPMVIPGDKLVLKKGEALAVNWTKDSSAKEATVRVRVSVDQHGTSPVELICELPDTGSATIPSSLVDQLIGFGVTGFPSLHVIRHTLDSVDAGNGCVQFEVYSHRLADFNVADHLPCDPGTPCPVGYTCDIPTGTCK